MPPMTTSDVRTIGEDHSDLIEFLQKRGYAAPLVISDPNTHAAAAGRLVSALGGAGIGAEDFVLAEGEPAADATSVGDILIGMKTTPDAVIGVGGGTVVDVARLVAHRIDRAFLSYPTAPSVDAYASPTSAMIFRGVKHTVPGRTPEAVFVNTDVLSRSPHRMIASGFGDIIAKLTAVPDWQLAALLAGEGIDEGIVERTMGAVRVCVDAADPISTHEAGGLKTLINALIDSGDCMTDWGGSRPASGSEHLLSHFWEMRALRDGTHSALHGEKVALGTVLVAGVFARLRQTGPEALAERISAASRPSMEDLTARAQAGFGAASAEALLADHFLATMTEAEFVGLRRAAADAAGAVCEIAEQVPEPAHVRELMSRVGGPTSPADIGVSVDDVRDALSAALFIRNRFGVLVFWHLFGLGDLDDLPGAVFS